MTIASSIAHTQSSASDPTISARNGKGVVGVGPPLASETGTLSSSLLKGGCMHSEAGVLVFCGFLLPSRYRLC